MDILYLLLFGGQCIEANLRALSKRGSAFFDRIDLSQEFLSCKR
jgi:hypothetical protein